MKVLFVYRNHNKDFINPIISNQSKSLIEQGIDIGLFPIRNGGLGYFKSLFKLRKYLKHNKYEIVHSHYGYTGIIVGIVNSGKTIASLMGSDIYKQNRIIVSIIKFFSRHIWRKTIVKSNKMNEVIKNATVIANGVNIELFKQKDRVKSKNKVGFIKEHNIVFIALHPEEKVKNLKLAQQAIKLIGDDNIHFHIINNLENEMLTDFYSAADILLLTSISEGSPNVIKEAMACNCPIVATDVGDIRDILGNTEGCYITSFSPVDVAGKIRMALEFSNIKGRTNGYQRILELGLDSKSVAKKIIKVYNDALSN